MTDPPSCSSPSLLLTLTLGSALFLAGCGGSAPTAGTAKLPDRFPNHSADQIRRQILGATDTLRAYAAKARITVQSPDQTRSFNAVVRHRRADSLLMRFSLFGVEGGRLLLTRDSVFFYNSRKAVLRVGPVQAVQQIFPAPVDSDQFFDAMLGLLAPEPRPSGSVQADSSLYYVSGPADREHYTVDPTHWRVVRYEQRSPSGTVLEKRLFSEFRPVEGLVLPAQLIFQRPAAGLRAVVAYRSMDLNPSDPSFALSVPAEVPRKPFR
ncbi:MAG: DUF4292 domain-containing protein [Bacteroidetes bacterium QH_2_63_10]|nr:MAG: DUF4292 domain-containing protein [Bacteroidetes bacterium QH_2_63_10]